MILRPPHPPVARLLLALVGASLLSLAAAHAHLDASTPGDRTVVTETVSEFALTFSEPVETAFSRFELVKLDVETQPDGYSTGGAAWEKLGEAAKALHDQLVKEGAAARTAQAPAGEEGGAEPIALSVQGAGAGAEVVIQVEGEMPAGDYMLFFNVLSVDTHSSSGYIVFSYQPEH